MFTRYGSLATRGESSTPLLKPIVSKTGLSTLIWFEAVACLCMVALRTWIQYRNSKRLFSNDYLIFVALACHLGAVITCELAITDMYDIEQLRLIVEANQVPSQQLVVAAERYLTYQFALLILLWSTLWSVKFSLLIFFWRLFDSVRTKVRAFWWIMIFITAATFVITIALQLSACGSPQNFFKLSGCATPYRLYLSNLVFLFSAGTDIAGDVLIVLIPFPLLWELRTSERQKLILVGIFLLPIVPIIFGILRLAYCRPAEGVVNVIKFQLYSLLENTAAIITACLPSLRLFVTNSRNNSRVHNNNNNAAAYYAAQSGRRSMKSQHHQTDQIALGSRTSLPPFDTRTFSRIESEEEAAINHGRPLRGGVVVTKGFEVASFQQNG